MQLQAWFCMWHGVVKGSFCSRDRSVKPLWNCTVTCMVPLTPVIVTCPKATKWVFLWFILTSMQHGAAKLIPFALCTNHITLPSLNPFSGFLEPTQAPFFFLNLQRSPEAFPFPTSQFLHSTTWLPSFF